MAKEGKTCHKYKVKPIEFHTRLTRRRCSTQATSDTPSAFPCQFIEKSLPPIKQATVPGILLNQHYVHSLFQTPGGRIITPIVQMRKLSLGEVELILVCQGSSFSAYLQKTFLSPSPF